MACPLQKIHFVIRKPFFDDLFWIIILREGQFLPKTKFFEGRLLGFHDFTNFCKIAVVLEQGLCAQEQPQITTKVTSRCILVKILQ